MKSHLFLAFNNLRRRKLRAWLTILGIFIGIAAVVSLISLGQGLQNFINVQFDQIGGNTIIVQPKSVFGPGTTNPELILTTSDLKAIRSVQGVSDAEGALVLSGVVQFKKEQNVVVIDGVSEAYINLFKGADAVSVIEGRQLRNGDRSKAVVGYNQAYGDLWNRPVKVGDKITIRGKEFDVVGVMKKQGNPIDDNAVWIEKDTMKELFNTGDNEGTIVVKTQEGFDPQQVADAIKEKLRKEKNQKAGEETFTVQTAADLLSTFSSIFAVVQAILVGIAAISLVVGGIGIMNTMYTSVLERTKEIGTMKAVGAKNSDILQIFLFESGLLGLVGGVIGIMMGIGIGKAVQYVAAAQLGNNYLQAVFGWQLILGALAFSFIIGAASGVLPAMQAAKLKPADALRYE